jgi:hypothetical protein
MGQNLVRNKARQVFGLIRMLPGEIIRNLYISKWIL